MEQHNNGWRYRRNKKYSSSYRYDYEVNGLLNKIISSRLRATTNPILKWFLGNVEAQLVFACRYVDKLKYFKNYLKENR